MTEKKSLKARIRARMAKTGERYTTARVHVVGEPAPPTPATDNGWTLRGGLHPETAALANTLANLGVTVAGTGAPVSEAMVLGTGGGLGAGYILWEFREHNARVLVLGFRIQWQYTFEWVGKTLGRLGVPVDTHRTGGAVGAAARLTEQLDQGRPCVVWPDRQLLGYWHLPAHMEATNGHMLVVYGTDGGRARLDDRNLAPLTVPREALDRARARIVSYRNALFVPRPEGAEIPAADLAAAAKAGIAECAEHLGGSSTSFALPAWRKWARTITDAGNAKGWPKVFADRVGLSGALLSAWEGIEPIGMDGGNLRALYADFLDEAADLLGAAELRACAGTFRDAAGAWHELAELALPASVPAFARLRELTAAVQESVAGGDAERPAAAAAAAELWALRGATRREMPLDDAAIDKLFAEVGAQLERIYEIERAAVARLGEVANAL